MGFVGIVSLVVARVFAGACHRPIFGFICRVIFSSYFEHIGYEKRGLQKGSELCRGYTISKFILRERVTCVVY